MAVGFFDSIHLGHQKVIMEACRLAKSRGTTSSVFLFKNNIFELIGVNKTPLFSFEDRLKFIEALGVDKVFYINATKDFLALSPSEFISFISRKLAIDGIVCGNDFSFGRNGEGKASDLLKYFPSSKVVDLSLLNGEKISTSFLKTALQSGEMDTAKEILGRNFTFVGKVIEGRKDGKKMGFPTVNMHFPTGVMKAGVYVTESVVNGERYDSLTNVGGHPTYGDNSENAETYLLDYCGDLYGTKVEIIFLSYLREIKKFDSVDSLVLQIEKDVKKRREYDTVRTIGNR